MSILKNLKSDENISTAKDSVGGGGAIDSDSYKAVVSMAYLTESKGGAAGLVFSAKAENGREIRQTFWMTSGKDKGQKHYYEKDGEKHELPGFTAANSLCLLTTGQEIGDLEPEKKVVSVYSYEAKAEVPTKVDVLTDLIGKEIVIGLLKQTVDKTTKNEATGKYDPTGETRDENEIDKFFHAETLKTVAELRAKADEAAFHAIWVAKWKGQVRNKAKGAAAGGTAGAPKAGGAGTKKPATSLFG
jgi:hypothetical protein